LRRPAVPYKRRDTETSSRLSDLDDGKELASQRLAPSITWFAKVNAAKKKIIARKSVVAKVCKAVWIKGLPKTQLGN
jgi:hypothetical protein